MIDTQLGEARLSEFVGNADLPDAALIDLTKDGRRASVGWFASGLELRIARAWTTPLAELSCAQARVLVGQELGLKWIAPAVAHFVTAHPQAECDLYPGDLTVVTLIAARHFVEFARPEAERMLEQDYNWLTEAFADDPTSSLLRDALAGWAAGRALIGA